MKNILFSLLFFVMPAAIAIGGMGLMIELGYDGPAILPPAIIILTFMVYNFVPWDAEAWWDRKWKEWHRE